MVFGYRSPGRKRANSPVNPHKATNKGSGGPFELLSWLCAEKQRLPSEDFQDPKKSAGGPFRAAFVALCGETNSALEPTATSSSTVEEGLIIPSHAGGSAKSRLEPA